MSNQENPELRKFVAPESVFGMGARTLVDRYVRNLGIRKVLLVTDRGVLAAGWSKEATDLLTQANIPCVVFSEVTENPKADEVMKGVALYHHEQCNGIVAVGGGSPMDCAKGIAIVSTSGGHILDYEGVDQVSVPIPPLICVPTTGGSSADVSQFAIITDSGTRSKKAIITKAILPDLALIDPMTLTTLSDEITANVGMDALSHALEAFVSNAHAPITDLLALDAFRLLIAHLSESLSKPLNPNIRAKVMLGSMEAGLAFSNASLGAVHAMAHSLGGLLDIAHGQCNALLLPHVIEFNFEAVPERYRALAVSVDPKFGSLSDSELKASFVAFLREFTNNLRIKEGLGRLGVARSDLARLSELALNDPCMLTNPRWPTLKEVEQVYERAL